MNRTLVIVLTVLWAIFGALSVFGAFMGLFLFDAPGSTESHLTVALFDALVALPICWFAGAILPWFFYKRAFAIWFFGLPLVNVVVIVGIFLAIDQFCNGQLACK